MKSPLLRLTLFSTLICNVTFADTGYVSSEIVNIRETPSTNSKIVGIVRLADSVEILEHTNQLDTVLGVGTHIWYKVRTGQNVGWVFGAFVAASHCSSSSNQYLAWSQVRDIQGISSKTTAIVFSNQHISHIFEFLASNVAFSPSCRFLAVDNGTDTTGVVTIYQLPSGLKLMEYSYFPRKIEWSGDSLKVNILRQSRGSNTHCLYFEEVIFSEGQLEKTGRLISTPIHEYGNESCNGA